MHENDERLRMFVQEKWLLVCHGVVRSKIPFNILLQTIRYYEWIENYYVNCQLTTSVGWICTHFTLSFIVELLDSSCLFIRNGLKNYWRIFFSSKISFCTEDVKLRFKTKIQASLPLSNFFSKHILFGHRELEQY